MWFFYEALNNNIDYFCFIQPGYFIFPPDMFEWYPIGSGRLWICNTEGYAWYLESIYISLIKSFKNFFTVPDKKEKLNPFFNWALNCIILAIYPALPIIDKDSSNTLLLMLGLVAWMSKICYAVKIDRNQFKWINCVVFCLGCINFASIIWDLYEKQGLSEMKQIISWVLLSMWLQLKFGFLVLC